MRLSVLVEGAHGLTWERWKDLVAGVEEMGYAGLYGSDHFTLNAAPPDPDSLELVVALAYAADHTRRLRLGQLVSPASFRDPVMLTRQMLALDDLSGGRMVFGVGAGWNVREHEMFGYDLGDLRGRMDRFAEYVEVIARLKRSDAPVSYSGRYYRLKDAVLMPRPRRPGGPPLLIGGGGPKRSLPLVARSADIWNIAMVTPEALQEKLQLLDALIVAAGRQPGDVARTLMIPVFCGGGAELLRWAGARRSMAAYAGLSDDALLDAMRGRGAIMGTPDEVVERIRAYGRLGIQEIMVQWFARHDLGGLRRIAEQVMPRVAR
ncbi:MAG TPA: LLM class flavin-dependent oxidoreductase [Candidatus Methylomirabilis sp.]|nr:LLM class flavin-dependent oxidoreductase [Candidatus Methylomirabilis sp.]